LTRVTTAARRAESNGILWPMAVAKKRERAAAHQSQKLQSTLPPSKRQDIIGFEGYISDWSK
jgi:hypothetical protein